MEEILHLSIGGEDYIPIHWENTLIEVKNKQSKYSAARHQSLKFIGETKNGGGLLRFLELVFEKQSELTLSNATEIELWVLIVTTNNDKQCNYSIGAEAINLLNALKASICIEYGRGE